MKSITFGKDKNDKSIRIITFKFISSIIKNKNTSKIENIDNVKLFIGEYFSETINSYRIGGNSTANNTSKNSIKKEIVLDSKNHKLICFKTMGDFLQILNAKL